MLGKGFRDAFRQHYQLEIKLIKNDLNLTQEEKDAIVKYLESKIAQLDREEAQFSEEVI